MLTHLIAQMDTPPPAALASWLSVAMYICGCIAAVIGAIVGIKSLNTPKAEPTEIAQPLHTKAVHDFATKPELSALAVKMDEELGRERGARKRIYEEITDIQVSVGSIRSDNAKQSIDLSELKADVKKVNERIDEVPERTINLLRGTKGLIS